MFEWSSYFAYLHKGSTRLILKFQNQAEQINRLLYKNSQYLLSNALWLTFYLLFVLLLLFLGFWNYKLVLLISNIADRGGDFSFFWGLHTWSVIRLHISTSIKPIMTKIGKQVHLEEFTASYTHHNRENLPLPLRERLSKNQKAFSWLSKIICSERRSCLNV